MLNLEKRMILSVILNFTITLAEFIGGAISGSLALVSDAIHNFSDATSILGSYIAIRIGKRKKNERFTFGYKRAEILVAFVSSLTLLEVCLYLLIESFKRLSGPVEIKSDLMLAVALIGFFANVFTAILLHRHASESMNVRAAYLHILSDSVSSAGVVIGALIIRAFNVTFIDSVITIIIALYISKESLKILKECGNILMECSPNIDFKEIKREIESIEGVKDAHHFHAWRIGEKDLYFECHVKVKDMPISKAQKIKDEIVEILRKHGVTHMNVQIEHHCNQFSC